MSEINPPINVLVDRARIRGASRMIASGTDPKDVTPEQMRQVADDLDLFCRENGVNKKSVAQATGYSAGVISEFCKGTYQGNNGKVAIDLDDWLVEEEERRKNTQNTEFVWTNVALQIRSVAEYCLDQKKIGLIYGPETSGLGKSTSLRAIYQRMGPRRSTLVTIDKVDASPSGLLKKILNAMHLDESGSSSMRMHRIVEFLSGRSHLLMIDQIHNLRFATEDRPFYYLADIYDATKAAQLWCGTSDLVTYFTRQQNKTLDEPLAQICRRIYPCVDLMEGVGDGTNGGEPLFTIDQVTAVFKRFKLSLTPAAARWLTALACIPGSGALGTCVNLVECATTLGQARKPAPAKSIDVPLLKEAMKFGLAAKRVQAMVQKVEERLDVALRVA